MRALERVVSILEAVAEGGTATPTEVVARVGLSLSTVARLMRQLAEEGLLERNGSDGAYLLGPRLLAIARSALEPDDLVEAALPQMQQLRDATGETVSLHVRRQGTRICIAQVQSRLPVRRVVPVGFTVPLHYGATGEALLAGLDAAELDEYLAGLELAKRRLRDLRARVDEARTRGWVLAVDAWDKGVSGVAATVAGGEVVASLSVSGPSGRWTAAAMRRAAPEVRAAAQRIVARLD